MSYRITQQMADFVNDVMLGEKRLFACKHGPPVVYLRRSVYNAEKYVVYQINKLLREGASPSDFFVLGGSVKGVRSAIRKMENALVEHNIPCHVPMMETDKIDERVIHGKVVFSTFHSVKGRQRKYVFVMGFDQSYFRFFARNLSPTVCPNTLYVACTRATDRLVVIENHNNQNDRPLLFLKMSHHELQKHPSIDFKGMPQSLFCSDEDDNNAYMIQNIPKHIITPTELIKFIPEYIIERILPILEKIFVKVNDESNEFMIDIPTVIETKSKFHEDVSDLNGIAIPLMYFDKMLDKSSNNSMSGGGAMLKELIDADMSELLPNQHTFLRQIVSNLPSTCTTIVDYLRLANVFVAVREKLYFKVKQIQDDEYSWLSNEMVNQCFDRIHRILYSECISTNDTYIYSNSNVNDPNVDEDFMVKIEKTIIHSGDDDIHSKTDACLSKYFPNKLFRFTARVDAITDKSVWEIKCVSELTNDHFLQVVIYAWLWRFCIENIEHMENIRDFRILNIRTGEIYRLEAETEELTKIMVELLHGKYGSPENADNSEFIEQCKSFL